MWILWYFKMFSEFIIEGLKNYCVKQKTAEIYSVTYIAKSLDLNLPVLARHTPFCYNDNLILSCCGSNERCLQNKNFCNQDNWRAGMPCWLNCLSVRSTTIFTFSFHDSLCGKLAVAWCLWGNLRVKLINSYFKDMSNLMSIQCN